MSIRQVIQNLTNGGPAEGTRVRAVWRDVVLAEALRPSSRQTICPWKGTASYYDVVAGDAVSRGAAWSYPSPKPAAADIKDRVAFWKGVRVEAVE